MLNIRKARKAHQCVYCGKKIQAKDYYVQVDKQNDDGSWTNVGLCENCSTKLIVDAISGE